MRQDTINSGFPVEQKKTPPPLFKAWLYLLDVIQVLKKKSLLHMHSPSKKKETKRELSRCFCLITL